MILRHLGYWLGVLTTGCAMLAWAVVLWLMGGA